MILREEFDVETRVVNLHTVKPLDRAAIASAAADTGVVITAEEHQVGGMGNRVAGGICEAALERPIKLAMVGVQDRFGESGEPWELKALRSDRRAHRAETPRTARRLTRSHSERNRPADVREHVVGQALQTYSRNRSTSIRVARIPTVK